MDTLQKDREQDIERIYSAALSRVDPYKLILSSLKLKKNILSITSEGQHETVGLDRFDKIIVTGAGKATAKMALAIEEVLGSRITKGVISVKKGHTENLNIIETIEAGHPIPDEKSVEAGRTLLGIYKQGDEKTLFINLISGGGSALLCAPILTKKYPIIIEEKQQTTKALLACGASIHEINCIRKHLSEIKGGRAIEAMYPATSINLILSDVVGDNLDTIASGLTAPDNSTFQDALDIIKRYNLEESIPRKVVDFFKDGARGTMKETPDADSGVFNKNTNILIGTNYIALEKGKETAQALGYNTYLLSSQITGDTTTMAKLYAAIGRSTAKGQSAFKRPACIIGGGETTVTIKGSGKGGRNQEMALAFLRELQLYEKDSDSLHFASVATDGNDGPTDAAGAYSNTGYLQMAKNNNLSVKEYLENNDSYHFFEKIGGLIKTGPTNTNVCDIHILIVV